MIGHHASFAALCLMGAVTLVTTRPIASAREPDAAMDVKRSATGRGNTGLSAWLDFDGAIKGESSDARHEDWIEIEAFSASSNREIVSRGSGGLTASRPSLSEFTLVKRVDRATPKLFLAAARGGAPYPKVTLDLNMGREKYVRIVLGDVLVSGQTTSATEGGDDGTVETISLNFTKITFIYYPTDSKPITANYDLEKGKAKSASMGAMASSGSELNGDSDGDGMPDSWEALYQLGIGTNDAAGDPDGDGFTNLEEFQLGTNPVSGSSFFKATLTAAAAEPGVYQLSWNSVPGKTYVIEWSPDLQTPFAALRSVTANGDSTTEDIRKGGGIGFYRVRPE